MASRTAFCVQGPQGRNGMPGKNGTPGRDGNDGMPGRDGEQAVLISLALKQRFASRAKELLVDELTTTYG